MKKEPFYFVLGLALLIWSMTAHLAGAAQSPSRRVPGAADEAAITQLARDLGAAIQSKDADRVMSLYLHSDDLVVFDPGPKFEMIGWRAYRDEWKRFFGVVTDLQGVEFQPAHIRVSGSLGYFSGRWRMKFTNQAGERVTLEGRVTDVLEKAEGKWRILHEHTSLPISEQDAGPVPEPGPEPGRKPGVEYFLAGIEGDGKSGIEGQARISPIHGGPVRVGEADSRPLPEAMITVQREGGSLVLAQQRTDARGKFRIALQPGKYLIAGLPPRPGSVLPRGSSQVIEVRAGQFTPLTIGYDSGLR